MFPLYDQTRRQICMAAFLGLCVLPTLAVTAGSVARHLPWHRQAEEQRLGQELGLAVSIRAMEHTQPGVVRYTGLKLTDPETGQELFRCAELAATWTSMTDSHGQTRPAIKLAATQAESATSAWERLGEVLRRRLECQSGRPEVEIRLTADQWTLHNGEERQVLQVVEETGVGLMPNGIQAQLAFRLPGVDSPQPVQMRIVRNRQVSPPANGFDLETGPSPVPCRLLAAYFREASALGPNCRFSGRVSTFHTPGGWSGELSGQLTGVDLASLARENSVAALTGTAVITLKKVKIQYGRIDEITGRLVCGAGAMGGDTLAALVRHLQLAPSPQVPLTGDALAFDRLGLDFGIDHRGIGIAGHCANMSGVEIPGAVAFGRGQVLLAEPASQPQPVAALIQALVATRQSGWLGRLLPLQDAARTN